MKPLSRRSWIMKAGVLVPYAASAIEAPGQILLHRRKAFRSVGGGGAFGGLVSTTNLVEHWRFDETSGDRTGVHASKVLTDNGTVGNRAGVLSNAADFTRAVPEYFTRSADSDFNTAATSFTLTFWFYADDTTSSCIINSGFNRTSIYNFFVYYDGNFRFRVISDTSGTAVTALKAASSGAWNFACCWYDHSVTTSYADINNSGSPGSNSVAGGCRGDTSATHNLSVGLALTTNDLPYDGGIDSVSFWTRVLTADERTALYNSGSGLDY